MLRVTGGFKEARGIDGVGDFTLLQDGIKRMQAFVLRRRYIIEDDAADAAKAALLATMVEKGANEFVPYSPDLPGLAGMKLADTVPVRLHKLRRSSPEAYYYWVKVSELL